MAERTPDFFSPEDEELVAILIKAIDDIVPELQNFCVNVKEEDEKERQARKSEFSNDGPEFPEDENEEDIVLPEESLEAPEKNLNLDSNKCNKNQT